MNPPPDYSWEPTAAPCRNCDCNWHALECIHCGCESSCLAPNVIIPANIVLGAE